MIKSINKFFDLPKDKQYLFLKNCIIEEKIAAYKFSIKIINQTTYKFYKNNKEITHDVIILNKIWEDLIKDWTKYFIENQDITSKYIGYIFYGFYFPCENPYNDYYYSDIKYLINNVTDWKGYDVTNKILKNDSFYKVQDRYKLENILNGQESLENTVTDFSDFINKVMINSHSVKIYGKTEDNKDNPFGWILKTSKASYQIQNGSNEHYESTKLPLELMMSDFVDYLNNIDYVDFISDNYVMSICWLFEDYIMNNHCHLIDHYKLTSDDLEPPYFGKYFGISYNYIPSEKTKKLCHENKLYENVFRIMLANFKRYKDFNRSIILSKQKIGTLNNFIKYIKIKSKV